MHPDYIKENYLPIAMKAVLDSKEFSSYPKERITLEYGDGGGCGAVFKIFIDNQPINRIVKIAISENPANNELLQNEIEVLTRLQESKYIVKLIDSASIKHEGKEYSYFIAEQLKPINPANVLYEKNPRTGKMMFSEQIAYTFIMEITQALCDFDRIFLDHEIGKATNRDIKEDNIMYCEENGLKVFKLIDFGLFSAYTGDTQTGDSGSGTHFMIAPERVAGNGKIHPANDIFGLASVLYHFMSKEHRSLKDTLIAEGLWVNTQTKDIDKQYLNALYALSIDDYYTYTINTDFDCYPHEILFDSNHLHGSENLRKLVREMMILDYRTRPSAKAIQVQVLNMIGSSHNLLVSVEDFKDCSGFVQYCEQSEAKKKAESVPISPKKPSNTQSAKRNRKLSPKKNKTRNSKSHEPNSFQNKPKGLPVGLLALFIVISDLIVNVGFLSLPLIDFSKYSEIILHITGYPPLYSENMIVCYIIPFVAAILVRLICLPMAIRCFWSLKYKFRHHVSFRVVPLVIIILSALGMGVFDIIYLTTRESTLLLCRQSGFFLRRFFDELLIVFIGIIGLRTIFGTEKFRPFYNIKQRIRNHLTISRFCRIIIAFSILIIAFLTPWLKAINIELNKEFHEEIGKSDSNEQFSDFDYYINNTINDGLLQEDLLEFYLETRFLNAMNSSIDSYEWPISAPKTDKIGETVSYDQRTITPEELDTYLGSYDDYANRGINESNSSETTSNTNSDQTQTPEDIVEERLKEAAQFNDPVMRVLSIIFLALVFAIIIYCPLGILLGIANEEALCSSILSVSFIKDRINEKDRSIKPVEAPSFRSLWKSINKSKLIELDANQYGLSYEEIDLIATERIKNSNGKEEGIETLSTVILDQNEIVGFFSPWSSHNIKVLSCRNCSLEDLSGLRTLNFIEKLDIHGNKVSSLQFLRLSHAFLTLKDVDVSDNYIPQEEFDSVLSSCDNLERLLMGDNDEISSIEFLENANKLKELRVENASLDDLSPLNGKHFESLSLVDCDIEDITVLGNNILDPFCDGVELDLRGNLLHDISVLPKTYYRTLRLSYNPIQDFTPLQYLHGSTIEISFCNCENFLEQLDFLEGFEHIVIQQVSLEYEGLIKHKLRNRSFELSTDANDPYAH